MRLDHLLSREPSLWGTGQHVGRLVGVLCCFLVPACVYCPRVGGGCGCVFWVGHKKLYERAHCRVHVQHRVSVRRLLVVVACAASWQRLLLVWVVCGGLFVICIVVASIFVLYCFLCFV